MKILITESQLKYLITEENKTSCVTNTPGAKNNGSDIYQVKEGDKIYYYNIKYFTYSVEKYNPTTKTYEYYNPGGSNRKFNFYCDVNNNIVRVNEIGGVKPFKDQTTSDAFRTWVWEKYPQIAQSSNLSKAPSKYIDSDEIKAVQNYRPNGGMNSTLNDLFLSNQNNTKIQQQQQQSSLQQSIDLSNVNIKQIERDALNPANVNPSGEWTKKRFEACEAFKKKTGLSECPSENEIKKYDPEAEEGNMMAMIEWLVYIVKWINPTFALIAKIAEIGIAVYHFVKVYTANDIKDKIISFFSGLGQLSNTFGKQIKIPGLTKFVDKLFTTFNSKTFGSVLTKVDWTFRNKPQWFQMVLVIISKYLGGIINDIIDGVVKYLLTPVYDLIEYWAPGFAKHIKNIIDVLSSVTKLMLVGKFLNDDPSIKNVFYVR